MTPNELATPKSKASKSESGIELNTYPSISYKSKLNEICQKMKSDSPSYSTVRASTGFVCTVVLNGQGMFHQMIHKEYHLFERVL